MIDDELLLNEWYAVASHRRARLSLGSFAASDLLHCAYHRWQFGADGCCMKMPAASSLSPQAKAAVCGFLSEKHGLIWVCLGRPARDVPDLPTSRVEASAADSETKAPAAPHKYDAKRAHRTTGVAV